MSLSSSTHASLSRWWNGVSLTTKITGVTVFVAAISLLVAGIGTMTVLRTYLINQVDSQVVVAGRDLQGQTISLEEDQESCASPSSLNNYYVAVLDGDGTLVCDNIESPNSAAHPDVSDITLDTLPTADSPISVSNDRGSTQWRVLAVPATISNGDLGIILVGMNLDPTNRTIAQYSIIFFTFGLAVVILGAAATRLLVTSTFAPLRKVEETAARFADGDFSQRLSGATPNTEVGRLNRSLNLMLNRIDRAFADRAKTIDQMRRFVGDASHELRTPLVSVRGYAELYRMGAIQKPEDVAQAMDRIEKEAIRMGELVRDLLELARLDEGKGKLQLAPVDLVPLAQDAARDAMAAFPDRTVSVVELEPPEFEPDLPDEPEEGLRGDQVTGRIRVSSTLARLRARRGRGPKVLAEPPVEPTPPPATGRAIVLAEENKLRQVITNLMGNAMRFTQPGSPIEIGVRADPARGLALLDVIDHGEGIPPQIRDKIFQRFWRADSSRNRDTGGSGLGLAIVASIVASHGGAVDVFETPGGGATFQVSLPLLPSESRPEQSTEHEEPGTPAAVEA
ncbi:sensor histidine kinase [Herbiconiux sp. SYSU D00978]|uniref:sensor histidine kinase n=1 Tax=Herbiconiux sp. SYSU D00978 TaxID=2812562 RepID=UPI0027DC4FB9|nr:HAMP domain-containing sensor histidine kinase [Herbiconiux sp. SYSU D00978]